MSDNDFYELKVGDEVSVVAFTMYKKYSVSAKVLGKSISKIHKVAMGKARSYLGKIWRYKNNGKS